ncbi:MAG TPA: glycosyltransferase family 39 protein [Solirubrobacteraceae bacterium]|nr:glycosyltransferase family 39 protein [Solirubrobacteraceae bacterium]
MTTTTAPTTDAPLSQSSLIREFTVPLPDFVKRRPEWLRVGGVLLFILLVTLWVRTRYVGQQFWMDEAITVGISSHSLSSIPGILRMDGSPPLFYMLLHFWMQLVGNGQAATHWLSEIFGLLLIPVGYWGGRTIAGRKAALVCAFLLGFNGFLDYYSVETRMYELMALLGLLATIGFINAFVYRRRAYLPLFTIAQALMFYTHAWAIYFGAGSFLTLVALVYLSEPAARKSLARDALMAYIAAVVLFLPWIPNFIFQAIHTAAPWDNPPRFGVVIQVIEGVLGGASIGVVMIVSAGIGYSGLVTKRGRMTIEARVALVLLMIPVLTLILAWCGSQITPNWVVRYFAPIVPALLMLLGIGISRAGLIGTLAILFVFFFMIRPSAFMPQYKSDMQDIGGEMKPLMHQGDLVIVAQPEQVPLAYYYLPAGLRFSSTIGPVSSPTYMDWVNALPRLKASNPQTVLTKEINSLKPGQQLLYIRPMTEGVANWSAPWTKEIRRKAAQWGAIIAADVQAGKLVQEAWAPHNYRGAPDIADSAVLYKKV